MSWIYQEKRDKIFISHLYESLKKEKDLSKKKIIVISGPTSVGKTELSIEIAREIGGEIISADSMQVYKNMDIGTAKVSLDQRKDIKHYLIDVCDVKNEFNVVSFYKKAVEAIKTIFLKNKVPIVVGGSGFYLHALLYGPPKGPGSNKKLREKLEETAENFGLDLLYEKLKELDPEYAETITSCDRHKIIRALEIIYISKKKVSSFVPSNKMQEDINFRLWFLYMPKEALFQKVEKRCDEMIEMGFIEEVQKLKEMGIEKNSTACHAIGYRQALDFLKTAQTKEDFLKFIFEFKKASRKYIKRQFTWFRKEKHFRWLDISTLEEKKILEYLIQDFENGKN